MARWGEATRSLFDEATVTPPSRHFAPLQQPRQGALHSGRHAAPAGEDQAVLERRLSRIQTALFDWCERPSVCMICIFFSAPASSSVRRAPGAPARCSGAGAGAAGRRSPPSSTTGPPGFRHTWRRRRSRLPGSPAVWRWFVFVVLDERRMNGQSKRSQPKQVRTDPPIAAAGAAGAAEQD
jgi:hypothetical protein